MKNFVKKLAYRSGFIIYKAGNSGIEIPIELKTEDLEIIEYVRINNLSMTKIDNLFTTALACKYLIERDLSGDFIECGVFRGGHSIIAAEFFKRYETNKKIYLFDTFKGMTEPGQNDYSQDPSKNYRGKYLSRLKGDYCDWAYSPIEEVKLGFRNANLLDSNIEFIEGNVLHTIPQFSQSIGEIAFLRLDTDFYDSTRVELQYLYPKLIIKGVLVVDDYGSWSGSRLAVDEFFSKDNKPFFSLISGGARVAIKL